jgi:hypothetical protein
VSNRFPDAGSGTRDDRDLILKKHGLSFWSPGAWRYPANSIDPSCHGANLGDYAAT